MVNHKKCDSFHFQLIAQERRVSLELENIPKTDLAGLEDFVARYSSVLSPRHSLILSAKQSLSVGYGRSKKCSTEREKKRKVELCREVLAVMRVLETGIATRIGKILNLILTKYGVVAGWLMGFVMYIAERLVWAVGPVLQTPN